MTELLNRIQLQLELEKLGSTILRDSRLPIAFLLLGFIGAPESVQAAKSGRPDQALVPPPPPVALDGGSGMTPGDFSNSGSYYPGFANGYSKFSSPYLNAYGGYGSGYSTQDSMAQVQKAIADTQQQYAKSFEVDLSSSDALRKRGLYRYAMGDVVGANSDLGKALSISPHDHQAAEALLDLWRRQVAANPNAVNGHLGLARAFLQTGNLEAAQAEYREVVRLDPNNPHLPAARDCMKLALARRASHKSLDSAKTLASVGEFKEAYEKTSEALSYCPTDISALLYKGQLCRKLTDYSEARLAYVAVLKEDPKNSEALKALKTLPAQAKSKPAAAIATSTRNPANHRHTASNEPTVVSSFNVGGVTAPSAANAVAPGDVSSLSTFLGSVRDLAIAQKNQAKKLDKGNKKTLQSLSLGSRRTNEVAFENPPVLRPEVPMMDVSGGKSSGAPSGLSSMGEDAVEMPKLAPPISQRISRPKENASLPIVPTEATGQTLSLELQKVAPSNNGITLKVLLRNDSERIVSLPARLKVAIKSPGQPEKLLPARFYANSVGARSSVKGIIRLPDSEFSPTTDIYLPNFPGNGISQRNLHLTTPVASL